jgi:hypothetical protein
MNIIVRVCVLMLICLALLIPTVMHAQTVCDQDKGITTRDALTAT